MVLSLAKVAIFATTIDVENQTLISEIVAAGLNRHFARPVLPPVFLFSKYFNFVFV